VNVAGPPSLIVFDLGRVLIRICDGWRHACEVAGVTPPAAAGELSAEAAAIEAAVCAAEVGQLDLDGFARIVAPHMGLTPQQVIAVHTAYTRAPYPGTTQLLTDLRAQRVRTACLSNTNANHWRLMTAPAGMSFMPFELLDYQFASHLVRLRKPDDAIYAHVERATETPGEQIVFFDDVEENIAAAARRGWHAHLIRTDADPIAQAREHLRSRGLDI
jgi:putative hydrolase of the HAD superfamily